MSCKRCKWKFHMVLSAMTVAMVAMLCAGVAEAAIIASENFESYPTKIGDPDPHFGGSGENGGVGSWTSAWELGTTAPDEMHVRQDLIHGFGKGLEISHVGTSSRLNVITRQFATQTDDFYVGLTMRTTIDTVGLDEHLLFYVSNTTANSHSAGYGAGALRGADVAGNFNTRQGGSGSHVDTGITQVYGQTYNLVFKVTKSGIATDPFDGIELWIDQATEGTPDAISASGTNSDADLSTFHIWFDPRNTVDSSNIVDMAHLAIDNLVVSTTYDEALSLTLVTGIPEPSSLCLVSLACVLCSFGARRARQRASA